MTYRLGLKQPHYLRQFGDIVVTLCLLLAAALFVGLLILVFVPRASYWLQMIGA